MAIHRNNPPQPLATGGLYRGIVQYNDAGQYFENIFDFMGAAGIANPGDAAAILTRLSVTMAALIKACITPTTQIYGCFVQILSDFTTPTEFVYPMINGTVTGNRYPSEQQVTVDKYTLLKGQHGRGRVQFPAVPISFCTPATNPDQVNATGVTAYSAVMTSYSTAFAVPSGTTVQGAVATRPTTVNTPYTHAGLITSYAVRPNFGTQRRRALGRGI